MAGLCAPAAFALPASVVSLHPVGHAFTTSTPTLTGTAGTAAEDGSRVYLGLYAGTEASGPLVRLVSAPRRPDGSFAIPVAPGLPDGFYTAVAGQSGPDGNSLSSPLVIEVKVHPPALSFGEPGDGVTIGVGATVFSGRAGTAAGDIPTVRLMLYPGSLATGSPATTAVIQTDGPSWSYTWPSELAPGSYTAIAQQADNAGHIVTIERSFRVTPPLDVVGRTLSLDRRGRVSVAITCPAEAGSCVGSVSALTRRPVPRVPDGPAGLVRLLYVHVAIPAGRTETVSGRLPVMVASALLRDTPMRVTVGAILRPTYGSPISVSETRSLRAG